ncbi:MAG: RidA family protein [Oscillospiraceae bacterium]|nr:RidA family protein [Oscillospiraceae bacterium]
MKEALSTPAAPAAIGPYSQGIRAGNLVFTSGQIPLDPATGLIPQGIEAQTRQAMENVLAVLAQAGATAENIVKTTVFLRNMDDFAAMNGVYATFFSGPAPARSAVQVARLPKDCPLEIEAVAVL